MEKKDVGAFKELIMGSAMDYDYEIPKGKLKRLWEQLEKYSLKQVSDALIAHRKDKYHGFKMPNIGNIEININEALIANKDEIKVLAHKQWGLALNSIRRSGDQSCLNESAKEIIKTIGWRNIGSMYDRDLPVAEKRFVEKYVLFSQPKEINHDSVDISGLLEGETIPKLGVEKEHESSIIRSRGVEL